MYVIIQSVVFYDIKQKEENEINFDYYVSLYVSHRQKFPYQSL